jgi:hypothetical protein
VRAVPVRNPTPQRHVYSVWRRSSAENHVRRHVHDQLLAVAPESSRAPLAAVA